MTDLTFYDWRQEGIEPVLIPIHQLLLNWGAWGRSRPFYGHCGSVEHKYRSPQCWYPPEPRPLEPNLVDALAVERTMRHLPKKHRKALVFCYVYRMRPELVWMRLLIRPYRLGEHMRDARYMVRNLLTRKNKRPDNTENSGKIPSSDETTAPYGAVFASNPAIGDPTWPQWAAVITTLAR